MKVALFVPCYVDLLYPEVGMATLELLEKQGIEVEYPEAQTCCGQPMANTGCVREARPVAEHFVKTFAGYEYIVCPSGSCTSMVRNHYQGLLPDREEVLVVCRRTYELCEFLTDIVRVSNIEARFPHRVGIHQSCHGLRELRLGSSSERQDPPFSKLRRLLRQVKDIEIVELERADECCGFGGTFSVNEEAVSALMGQNRIADHERAGAEYIVAADMSCLMHMQGLIQREKKSLQVKHIAEVLNA
ncbi:MAG: (Fe-S)-binding protein [Myxococcales bacterium]|jgi:L-lactate dehydrogenase complex protein LldE